MKYFYWNGLFKIEENTVYKFTNGSSNYWYVTKGNPTRMREYGKPITEYEAKKLMIKEALKGG